MSRPGYDDPPQELLNLGKPLKVQSRTLIHQKGSRGVKFWPGKDCNIRGRGCPHSLLIRTEYGVGVQVLGAPRVNPEVGRIAYNPNKNNVKYIKYVLIF